MGIPTDAVGAVEVVGRRAGGEQCRRNEKCVSHGKLHDGWVKRIMQRAA